MGQCVTQGAGLSLGTDVSRHRFGTLSEQRAFSSSAIRGERHARREDHQHPPTCSRIGEYRSRPLYRRMLRLRAVLRHLRRRLPGRGDGAATPSVHSSESGLRRHLCCGWRHRLASNGLQRVRYPDDPTSLRRGLSPVRRRVRASCRYAPALPHLRGVMPPMRRSLQRGCSDDRVRSALSGALPNGYRGVRDDQ